MNFILGKNRGYTASSLGCRLIVVVSEWDKVLTVFELFKIWQLRFYSTFKFFEWIYGANSVIQIDFMVVFWRKMLLSGCSVDPIFGGSHTFPCWSLLLSTSVLNDTSKLILQYLKTRCCKYYTLYKNQTLQILYLV